VNRVHTHVHNPLWHKVKLGMKLFLKSHLKPLKSHLFLRLRRGACGGPWVPFPGFTSKRAHILGFGVYLISEPLVYYSFQHAPWNISSSSTCSSTSHVTSASRNAAKAFTASCAVIPPHLQ
jgi:hypothetical protein